ncbi:MAG: hypothetical protein KBT58_06225 [Bizionia sp.]|nr:hypothetical protein [Bizionia sp.]
MSPTFKYNPFSGVLAEDLNEILVPRFDRNVLMSKIKQTDKPIAIEFLGKKGRGKTTHLLHLNTEFIDSPIVFLNSNSSASEVLNNDSNPLFIDSIHHLGLPDRLRLFKQNKTIIYTTHYTRKWECRLLKKEIYSLHFNGIDPETLQHILNKRLLLASDIELKSTHLFSVTDSLELIKKFKDNYRAIINHLYVTYQ